MVMSFFITCVAFANEQTARQAAQNFLSFVNSPKTIVSVSPLESRMLDPSKSAVIAGWIFNLNEGGYILISASPNRFPVKAYSLENDFLSLPSPYRTFLEKELELYARLNLDMEQTQRHVQSISENNEARDAWNFLLEWDPAARRTQADEPGTHLLTTTWDQGYPYNKFLPEIEGKKVLAGCLPVAVAQVMKFHGHPLNGRGISSYIWNDQSLETILYHPYHWENMPDTVTMSTSPHLQDEVAILMRDLGIVNKSEFGLKESRAAMDMAAFVKFFGYSNTIDFMKNDNTDLFFSTLKSQIDQNLPVLLSFPGHMVVVDGEASDDETGRKFHVNMGWGGLDNNYYYLDEPVQTTYYNFSPDLEMIYNVKPCSGADCVVPDPVLEAVPPKFMTQFKDRIIPADDTLPVKMRIDARDGNGDDLTLDMILSNSETVSAELENDILTIQPVSGSQNKAVTVRIVAASGSEDISADFVVMVADGNFTYGKEQVMTGHFDSQDGVYAHPAVLEGFCNIFVDRGYSNQGFFVYVQDGQGQVVATNASITSEPRDTPAIAREFDPGVYTIFASLKLGNIAYPFDEKGDYNNYLIEVDAPEAETDVNQVASLLGIDLSGIRFTIPGDITGDEHLTLADKIWVLKILSRLEDAPEEHSGDVNGDERIGIEEAVYWP
jgi:hypothetical protein